MMQQAYWVARAHHEGLVSSAPYAEEFDAVEKTWMDPPERKVPQPLTMRELSYAGFPVTPPVGLGIYRNEDIKTFAEACCK